ncbi:MULTISPECIES: phosphate ABC transporter permease subunit PstC [unclassified Halobacterium]|uniref:phosphate ABC transporter permease subunit PstC n=1 Tax=unclassified Halobacterium TaxID=2668073 RepID=UPI001E5A48BF|nr:MULTISPECIES: phosphate ABC transporter permease subunit PstC [unclassified Halobacterium]MCD2201114.1 phosphate ABC transporter permease subunit PstC [Halobacterium sp. KA-4]MCD2203306.1 phosphate ABC transporter permease subunit PstC [Halobacterium sp. KA-6]
MSNESTKLRRRLAVEGASSVWFRAAGYFAVLVFVLIGATLVWQSLPILSQYSLVELLTSATWDPARNQFGFMPAIVGTLAVSGISMVIGAPIAILTAIYLAEYATDPWKSIISSFVDALAAIPGVVFGLVGLIVVVPFVRNYLAPAFGADSAGQGILTASLVMSIVVTPFIVSLTVESLEALPRELREATLSLGATDWEVTKHVLLRAAGPGILSALLLGFGRVFGATIVPAMLIGSQTVLPESVFSPGQTLTTVIVNDFGELMSLPLTQSALIFVGLLLLVVVWLFNFAAMLLRRRLERRWQY